MRYKFVLIDAVLIVAAYFLGLGVRLLDPGVVQEQQFLFSLVSVLPFIIAVHLGCNLAMGAYRRDWVHSGLAGARRVGLASAIAVPVLLALGIAGRGFGVVVPFSTVLLGGIGALVGMVLVRFLSRSLPARASNQAGQ